MTEAPVVMVFCRMEPDGRYHIEFRPGLPCAQGSARDGRDAVWVRHFIEILEDQVRRYPSNSNDYFFWSDCDDAGCMRHPAIDVLEGGTRHAAVHGPSIVVRWRRTLIGFKEARMARGAATVLADVAGAGPGWSWP